jgi:hypothetical protein
MWLAVTMSIASGQPIGPIFHDLYEPRIATQAIVTAVAGSIWIIYLAKSRRAANTFVE